MAPKRNAGRKDGRWGSVSQDVELHGEPLQLHGPEVAELQRRAVDALRARDPAAAEALLQEALALEPDAPDLLNNLAVAYEMQGRIGAMEELVRLIFERNPDYLIGRANLVHLHVRAGAVDRARKLMAPLVFRRRMHFSEFAALCAAQIDVALAGGDLPSARMWLRGWEEILPDHAALPTWQRQVADRLRAVG